LFDFIKILVYTISGGDDMKTTFELFWSATFEDLKRGFTYDSERKLYICLICGKTFQDGHIFPFEVDLLDAKTRMVKHLEHDHHRMVNFLLSMDKKYTGLSDIQIRVLNEFVDGKDDSQISKILSVSKSNVRNHRFRLKEKAKQAKIFLAIYELIEKGSNSAERLIDFHLTAKQVDERYAITESERQKCLSKLFDSQGRLTRFPSKEKEKIIIMLHIVSLFEVGKKYNEKELNLKLKEMYPDYPLLRRYLIEYGFLDRKKDGSEYWVKSDK